ncbi:MAG: metallophosphoesterase [Patescibacteria group bacterium]|nr:metallophosphoesterase [Patescibacteria group bacterium]
MPQYYDLLILIMLIITAYPAVIFLYSIYKRPKSFEAKHKKTFLIISIILLLGTSTLLWGSFIEPKLIVINKQEIDLENITEPIKIAFISDLHVGPYKKTKWVEKVVNKIIKQKPDLVFIGGDNLYNSEYTPEEIEYLKPLSKLAELFPTYSINGNHEYGIGDGKNSKKYPIINADWSNQMKLAMEKLNINYLQNDLELLKVRNQEFYLFGSDSILAGKLDFNILNNKDEDLATIALIHNPLFLFITNYPKMDLTLSGHTHGGQIRLPFLGPIGKVDNLLPANFYQGLHNLPNEQKIFVTSGIGESGPRARLFNPPEIVMITIK